jgi:hypothetical protein
MTTTTSTNRAIKTTRICAGEYEILASGIVWSVSKDDLDGTWWAKHPSASFAEDCYSLKDAKEFIANYK